MVMTGGQKIEHTTTIFIYNQDETLQYISITRLLTILTLHTNHKLDLKNGWIIKLIFPQIKNRNWIPSPPHNQILVSYRPLTDIFIYPDTCYPLHLQDSWDNSRYRNHSLGPDFLVPWLTSSLLGKSEIFNDPIIYIIEQLIPNYHPRKIFIRTL